MSLSENKTDSGRWILVVFGPVQLVVLSPLCRFSELKEYAACSWKNRYSGEEMAKKEHSDSLIEALIFSMIEKYRSWESRYG